MATLMQRGNTWHAGKMQDAAGVLVSLRRKTATSLATFGGRVNFVEYQVADESNVVTVTPVYDWTFTAAEVELAGVQTLPREGDRIVQGSVEYEVLPIGNMKCVSPFGAEDDSGNPIQILVHTKKVVG